MTEQELLEAQPTAVTPTDTRSFTSISPDQRLALDERKAANTVLWVKGRAFVYAESGEVEYFYRFEKSPDFPKKDTVRSFRGDLRALDDCRPLDYVCDPKYLK